MKSSIFFLSIILACNSQQVNNAGTATDTTTIADTVMQTAPSNDTSAKESVLNGNWQLENTKTAQGTNGFMPMLNFNIRDSSFSGSNGCNSINGHFVLKGEEFSFGETVSTKKACPGYNEKSFMDNLSQTNKFKVENDILMFYNNDKLLSTWKRNTDLKDTTNKT